MGDAQADVPEDIFARPEGPRLSAADMGERMKKEVAEAKKRKKSALHYFCQIIKKSRSRERTEEYYDACTSAGRILHQN